MTTTQGGARPPYEELEVGMEIPSLRRGPMAPAHLMRWSAATENWHRIHYDAPYAAEVEKLPGLLVSGNWKQQTLVELMTEWLRPDGWLARIGFEFRKMNVVGETLTAWGRITGLREHGGFGVVECEIGIANDEGTQSTPGTAVGIVPLAGGAAVPYPFELDWEE